MNSSDMTWNPDKDPKAAGIKKRFLTKRRANNLCVYCGSKEDTKSHISCKSCREKSQKRHKAFITRARKAVFDHYGCICVCCGEANEVFLSMDHIEGGGGKHRKNIMSGNTYRWIQRNNFPSYFQVLCFNCNWAKYINGICPHQI